MTASTSEIRPGGMPMTKTSLEFLRNEADEAEGLSDAGIETFRDNPFSGVARETGQNSRDARLGGKPVTMVFEKVVVPTDSFPSISLYREAAARCLTLARLANDEKEIEFFVQATRRLDSSELSILRISDSNTRGLEGPCVAGKPFHSLVKATGVSSKESETSGGSFGIGKSAVYAASDIQTAFYSTLYEDESGEQRFLSQGKTRFRSFTDAQGIPRRSVGYWGNPEGFTPLVNQSEVPSWLRRNEIGTTICAIAMRESHEWQNTIIASAVQNFFCAIHREEMNFKIDGISINKNNLLRFFNNDGVKAAAIAAGAEEDFAFANAMYDCLRQEEDTIKKSVVVSGAGTFKIQMMLRENLPKRIGFVRNGMYITDNLKHFGQKFQKFPMYSDFVAIVEPAGQQESVWLKRLENPRHDELSPERIPEVAKRESTKDAGRRLANAIRTTVKEAAKTQSKAVVDLDELNEFFVLEGKGKKDEQGIRDPSTFKIVLAPQPPRTSKAPPPRDDDEGNSGGAVRGEQDGGKTGGFGEGRGEGWGKEGTGKKSNRKPMLLGSPRTMLVDGSHSKRRIYFTPSASGRGTFSFESSGLNDSQPIAVKDGPIQVACVKDDRQYIDVEFSTPYDGPIEIISWIDEETGE